MISGSRPGFLLRALPFLSVALVVAAMFGWPSARTHTASLWLLGAAAVSASIYAYQAAIWSQSLVREIQSAHTHAELLSRESERQQEAIDALADGLDIAVFICDSKGTIEFANRKATRLFRFTQPVGRSILAVTLSYDIERLIADTADGHEPLGAEFNLSYPDERVGLVRAWLDPDRADRVFLSILDITDLRRLERVRQDFVANVSHELRTPMTSIRAMAETLAETDDDPALHQRYLAKIIAEVDRLSLISNDLLVLSTAESKHTDKEAVNLTQIVAGVVQQLADKARKKGLEIRFEGSEPLQVLASENQMTQVAMNLIDNAINYTTTGNIDISLSRHGTHAVLKIADTGVGIASEHLPRIFERFYRVDKARSRESGGTGLGLSIVKHIVEAHGGEVSVESSLNKGSEFTVILPLS